MPVEIHHSLHYRYTPAVFIESTLLRLRPRSDFAHWLLTFELTLDPAPAGRAEILDAHGNVVTWAWFTGEHEHLRIDARSSVDVHLSNPFDYLIADVDALTLPIRYDDALRPVLDPFCRRAHRDPQIDAWVEQLRAEADNQTQAFLSAALQRVYETCEMTERDTGDPHPPGHTIESRCGACRDLAVLFMELCRGVGLAARFVSGYHLQAQETGQRQLHAWVEVYLPGGGWRGYDPSYGLVVADQHVALAAGRTPADAAPTRGAYRGTGAQSTFEFHIHVRNEQAR